jgi:hypothetical protein
MNLKVNLNQRHPKKIPDIQVAMDLLVEVLTRMLYVTV